MNLYLGAGAGCPDQSANCLRTLPVSALVDHFPGAAIPGVVDGKVLKESIGTALAGADSYLVFEEPSGTLLASPTSKSKSPSPPPAAPRGIMSSISP